MTLGIMTLGIMTLVIMTLGIMTLGTMTLDIMILGITTQHNNKTMQDSALQHSAPVGVLLNAILLIVVYAECHSLCDVYSEFCALLFR
jgi:hypothetical protein